MIIVVATPDANIVREDIEEGGSNNIAEFIALKAALEHAAQQGVKEVRILTDSRNNLAWFHKEGKNFKKINDPARVTSIKQEIELLKSKMVVSLKWIRREDNLAGQYIEKKYSL